MVKTARKPKKSWKRYQADNQSQKRLFLGIGVLVVIVLVVILGKFLSFVGALGQPFSADGDYVKREHLWSNNSPINLAVKAKEVSFLSLNPQTGSLLVVKVPDETYLQASLGFGRWPTRSIYQLGQSEEKKLGGYLLKLTLSSTVGAPVNGYLILKDEKEEVGIDQLLEEIRSSPVSFLGLLASLKTDLSLWELFRLFSEVRGVRFDKIETVDLSQSQVTSWILLSDGRRALEINQSLLDKTVGPSLEDEELSLEGISVAIYNSTSHPGLAEKAARLVSNMGGRVVITSVIEPEQAESLIIGPSSYSYQRLGQVFAPLCLKSSIISKLAGSEGCRQQLKNLESASQQFRLVDQSQITIILGEDYYQKFNAKP